MTRYRPVRTAWSAVVRASRRCIVTACYGFFVAAAVAYQIVTIPTVFLFTLVTALWCIVVGKE